MTLNFNGSLTKGYPFAKPHLQFEFFDEMDTISASLKDDIKKKLNQRIDECIGREMIFDLVETARVSSFDNSQRQECIAEFQSQEQESFYDQMIQNKNAAELLIKEKFEEDALKKEEEMKNQVKELGNHSCLKVIFR